MTIAPLLMQLAQAQAEPGITAIIGQVLEKSALAALAIFAIFMLNRVWEARQAEAERYAAQLKELYQEVRQALEHNTEAMTRLCERMGDRGHSGPV